jgi:thiamine-monophosphate kinase
MKRTEDTLVAQISRSLSRDANPKENARLLGPGDDAAIYIPSSKSDLILTCDWFLEGAHFLRALHPPDSVGWKCLARAVSDIAAMGGEPTCFLLSLALPQNCAGKWLESFLGGLQRASKRFNCALAGGDTTKRDEILIQLTVIGEARKSTAIRRSGARPGDLIFVSGRLGEAELGLRLLRRRPKQPLAKNAALRKHLYPQPRIELGQWLARNKLATALMDLSDGLSIDLQRLCKASGVGARISSEKLPLPVMGNTRQTSRLNRMQLALNGGDDYELLFTVPRKRVHRIPPQWRGLPLTTIGEVTRTKKVLLSLPNGRDVPLAAQGWDPFRS